MKDLLEFIIEGITGASDFNIEEEGDENHVSFIIKAKKDNIGLIIGKNGKTIRAIRTLLRVRATLDKKAVSLSVSEA